MSGRCTRVVLLAAAVAAFGAAGCGGGDEGAGGTAVLDWYIFNEPSGAPQEVAKECSRQSDGRYRIRFQYLPSDTDSQREQLVRRLGAEDSSIDLIGMDVIWTGEFANARWLARVPKDLASDLEGEVFEPMLDSATFEDRLYGVPAWSNTQLLWYRKDRVDRAPETWDEMMEQAEKLGAKGTIQVQANRYEGLVVWANTMIQSAGGQIIAGPREVALPEGPTKLALGTMGRLANSPAAAADISTSNEDTGRLGFESGDSTFMLNYPFVYPSAKENAPKVFENMGAAKYPAVKEGTPSKPPLGGINIGVSAFSPHKDVAWEAARCLTQPDAQLLIARKGGLPPVSPELYDRTALRKEIYPGFADLIRDSISTAAPRPSESPAYQDLSLAIQREVHPVEEIDPQAPQDTYESLKERVQQAVDREGLL